MKVSCLLSDLTHSQFHLHSSKNSGSLSGLRQKATIRSNSFKN